jgi:hypothetical protein
MKRLQKKQILKFILIIRECKLNCVIGLISRIFVNSLYTAKRGNAGEQPHPGCALYGSRLFTIADGFLIPVKQKGKNSGVWGRAPLSYLSAIYATNLSS